MIFLCVCARARAHLVELWGLLSLGHSSVAHFYVFRVEFTVPQWHCVKLVADTTGRQCRSRRRCVSFSFFSFKILSCCSRSIFMTGSSAGAKSLEGCKWQWNNCTRTQCAARLREHAGSFVGFLEPLTMFSPITD